MLGNELVSSRMGRSLNSTYNAGLSRQGITRVVEANEANGLVLARGDKIDLQAELTLVEDRVMRIMSEDAGIKLHSLFVHSIPLSLATSANRMGRAEELARICARARFAASAAYPSFENRMFVGRSTSGTKLIMREFGTAPEDIKSGMRKTESTVWRRLSNLVSEGDCDPDAIHPSLMSDSGDYRLHRSTGRRDGVIDKAIILEVLARLWFVNCEVLEAQMAALWVVYGIQSRTTWEVKPEDVKTALEGINRLNIETRVLRLLISGAGTLHVKIVKDIAERQRISRVGNNMDRVIELEEEMRKYEVGVEELGYVGPLDTDGDAEILLELTDTRREEVGQMKPLVTWVDKAGSGRSMTHLMPREGDLVASGGMMYLRDPTLEIIWASSWQPCESFDMAIRTRQLVVTDIPLSGVGTTALILATIDFRTLRGRACAAPNIENLSRLKEMAENVSDFQMLKAMFECEVTTADLDDLIVRERDIWALIATVGLTSNRSVDAWVFREIIGSMKVSGWSISSDMTACVGKAVYLPSGIPICDARVEVVSQDTDLIEAVLPIKRVGESAVTAHVSIVGRTAPGLDGFIQVKHVGTERIGFSGNRSRPRLTVDEGELVVELLEAGYYSMEPSEDLKESIEASDGGARDSGQVGPHSRLSGRGAICGSLGDSATTEAEFRRAVALQMHRGFEWSELRPAVTPGLSSDIGLVLPNKDGLWYMFNRSEDEYELSAYCMYDKGNAEHQVNAWLVRSLKSRLISHGSDQLTYIVSRAGGGSISVRERPWGRSREVELPNEVKVQIAEEAVKDATVAATVLCPESKWVCWFDAVSTEVRRGWLRLESPLCTKWHVANSAIGREADGPLMGFLDALGQDARCDLDRRGLAHLGSCGSRTGTHDLRESWESILWIGGMGEVDESEAECETRFGGGSNLSALADNLL